MKFSVALFMIFLLCACKKEKTESREITGYVYHEISRQPIPNHEVILEYTEVNASQTSPEYPNGTPHFVSLKTYSDQAGRFRFRVPEHTRAFLSPHLGKGIYVGSTAIRCEALPGLTGTTVIPFPKCYPELFDTLFAEKAGYIRYSIQNIGDQFENDTVLVKKSYLTKHSFVSPAILLSPATGNRLLHYPYQPTDTYPDFLGFVGKTVNEIITDTLAAESKTTQQIEWIYKRSDMISIRTETIALSPGVVLEVRIAY